MIYLYSGTPGSGKSLHVAKRIYDLISYNHPVVSNFDVNLDRIPRKKHHGNYMYLPNHLLTTQKLIDYSAAYFSVHKFREGAITLIIDEAQLMFNARSWDQKGRTAWLSFFSQHRHYGYDVILVAQFDRMLDRQIRSLIEYEYIHRKVSNYGAAGKVLSIVAFGKLFCCVKVWYPLSEKIGSEFYTCKKKYYMLYDTTAVFAADGV